MCLLIFVQYGAEYSICKLKIDVDVFFQFKQLKVNFLREIGDSSPPQVAQAQCQIEHFLEDLLKMFVIQHTISRYFEQKIFMQLDYFIDA